MTTPAENAATVEDALNFAMLRTITGTDAYTKLREGKAALDALLAQAEADDPFWLKARETERDFAEARAFAAEADRDAAVRERNQSREALRSVDQLIAAWETSGASPFAAVHLLGEVVQVIAALTGEGTPTHDSREAWEMSACHECNEGGYCTGGCDRS